MANDTINRQTAILAIEEYADRLQMVNWKENPGVPYKAHALNWAINTLRDLPSAERWIPVAERRPEAYGRYLVTLEYEGYRSVMPLYYGRINRIDTFYDSDSEYGDIEYCGAIAWMPLPEPYKGGVEE